MTIHCNQEYTSLPKNCLHQWFFYEWRCHSLVAVQQWHGHLSLRNDWWRWLAVIIALPSCDHAKWSGTSIYLHLYSFSWKRISECWIIPRGPLMAQRETELLIFLEKDLWMLNHPSGSSDGPMRLNYSFSWKRISECWIIPRGPLMAQWETELPIFLDLICQTVSVLAISRWGSCYWSYLCIIVCEFWQRSSSAAC